MQHSIVRLVLAAGPKMTRVKQDWPRKASSDLSGRLKSHASPLLLTMGFVFLLMTGEAPVWSRPTWRSRAETPEPVTWQGWSALSRCTLFWHNSKPGWQLSYQGVRIGEAKNPGPPSESATQESRWPFAPSSQASGSQDSEAAGPAALIHAGPAQEADGQAPIALPPTQPEAAPQEHQRQGLPAVLLRRNDGQHSRLSCRYVHSVGAWRWSLPGTPRLTADHRTSPYHGLVQWYDHHAHLLEEESREEVVCALTQIQCLMIVNTHKDCR